ncbi:integrase core domain protein, partial [Lasius niger]
MADCRFKKSKEDKKKPKQEETDENVFIGETFALNWYKENEQEIAFMGGTPLNEADWCMDSGASEHMCNNLDFFENYRKVTDERKVKIGNGTFLKICGVGTVELDAWNGQEWIKTKISNVLFVPELKINLFSLGCALDKGYEMRSDNLKCELVNKNGQVCAIAKRQEEDPHPICKDCLVGKQHRSSYPASQSRASRTCELIHGDLCGPMETTSLGGAKYFLLLKDDYSSYRYVYFIQHKSEVKQKIAAFIKMAETETGNKVKILRTDNGLEFMNQDVKSLLEENGINHQRSVVYTPQQNGRAEREMRTIVEASRTMLHSMNMSKIFWAKAVNTAVFTLNRTGSSPENIKPPFELWHSKKPDINIFKVFGSKVAAHIPKERRLKFDAKSKEGIVIGYSENTKGYRIYFPQKKKVEILKDIVFLRDENERTKETGTSIISEEEEAGKIVSETIIEMDEIQEDRRLESDNESEGDERTGESSLNDDYASCEETEELTKRYELRDRSKLRKPTAYEDYEVNFTSLVEENEPQTYVEAMSGRESEMWKRAMKTEMEALKENDTWTVMKKPEKCELIDSKWVFKKKRNEKGDVITYKARLVARGFKQKNMDVCNAFLYGKIDSDVYMSLLQGFNLKTNEICKLKKTLYGLKGSPKGWNNRFHAVMIEQGFIRSEYDYCLYVRTTKLGKIFILLYVDDLLLAGTDKQEVLEVKSVLNRCFKMKDFGNVKHFLGIVIEQKLEEEDCIVGYVDSDWAGDNIDRRSTAGYIFKVLDCLISWSSKKQPTVALSSTEAEYAAMSIAASEACWLRFLFKDFMVKKEFVCVKLYEDNQSAIR